MKDTKPTQLDFLGKTLAFAGLATCLLAVFWSWKIVETQQPIWLLPGLYLVEIAAVGIMAMYGILRGTLAGVAMAWMSIGILFGFALMGAWSVGLLFVPSALIFIAATLLSNRGEPRQHVIEYAVIGTFACVCQIALMFVVVWLSP